MKLNSNEEIKWKEKPIKKDSQLVGKWKIETVNVDGTLLDQKVTMYLILHKDKTYVMAFSESATNDEVIHGDWEFIDGKLLIDNFLVNIMTNSTLNNAILDKLKGGIAVIAGLGKEICKAVFNVASKNPELLVILFTQVISKEGTAELGPLKLSWKKWEK